MEKGFKSRKQLVFRFPLQIEKFIIKFSFDKKIHQNALRILRLKKAIWQNVNKYNIDIYNLHSLQLLCLSLSISGNILNTGLRITQTSTEPTDKQDIHFYRVYFL